MSSPNADLIAVSLACPKDPKNLLSEGSNLKKVVSEILRNGIRRKFERHCSSGPILLGIFDIYRSTLTQSKLSRIINLVFSNGFFEFEIVKLFLDAYAVPYSQRAPNFYKTLFPQNCQFVDCFGGLESSSLSEM